MGFPLENPQSSPCSLPYFPAARAKSVATPLAASNAPWLVSKLSCQPEKSWTTYSQDTLEFPLTWLAVALCRPCSQLKAMPYHRFSLQGGGRLELGEALQHKYQNIPVQITKKQTISVFFLIYSFFVRRLKKIKTCVYLLGNQLKFACLGI